jgi:hypothetical protein
VHLRATHIFSNKSNLMEEVLLDAKLQILGYVTPV